MKADRQTPLTCRNRRVGETTRAVRDRRLCFVVPVAGEYARMARALGNSVRHFHPHSRLVAVATGTPPVEISVLAESGPFDEVVAFEYDELEARGRTATADNPNDAQFKDVENKELETTIDELAGRIEDRLGQMPEPHALRENPHYLAYLAEKTQETLVRGRWAVRR